MCSLALVIYKLTLLFVVGGIIKCPRRKYNNIKMFILYGLGDTPYCVTFCNRTSVEFVSTRMPRKSYTSQWAFCRMLHNNVTNVFLNIKVFQQRKHKLLQIIINVVFCGRLSDDVCIQQPPFAMRGDKTWTTSRENQHSGLCRVKHRPRWVRAGYSGPTLSAFWRNSAAGIITLSHIGGKYQVGSGCVGCTKWSGSIFYADVT